MTETAERRSSHACFVLPIATDTVEHDRGKTSNDSIDLALIRRSLLDILPRGQRGRHVSEEPGSPPAGLLRIRLPQ